MKGLIIAAAAAALVAGCATNRPQLSRDEWLKTTTHVYQGVTKEQALEATEKLFRLADGDDFTFFHTEDGMTAVRKWSFYLVLAAGFGTDYWNIKAVPVDGGVKVTAAVSTQAQGIAPMPTTANNVYSAGTTPMAGSPVDGTAIYDVFWARLEYLLGKRTAWMTCKEADDRVSKGVTWGINEALCNSLNMKDTDPTKPNQDIR